MTKRITVGLVCGGQSSEHEVSLLSAQSIFQFLDKTKYEVVLIGIDKKGNWHLGENESLICHTDDPKNICLNLSSVTVTPVRRNRKTVLNDTQTAQELCTIDIFFPIIHGTTGEDGCLQGLFTLLNTPYVGAGVIGSAIGMDKDVAKRLLKEAGLPIGRFVTVRKWDYHQEEVLHYGETLGYPVFVKPANSGSSVGVTKVKRVEDLHAALARGFKYDNKVLIEEYIQGREIECSVLGNDNPQASLPGEIVPHHEFYSYEAKYLDDNGAGLEVPAKLDQETITAVQQLAIKTYQTLECKGMARVDFFLKPNGELFINEINTLPGFTKISMYPKLWEVSGLPYPQLLNRLIELALEENS